MVEPLLGLLGLDLLLSDLFAKLLRLVEDVDGIFVVEYIIFSFLEYFQDCCLCFLHPTLVIVLSQDQCLVLLFQLHVFFTHNQVEKLLAKAFEGDHEVNDLHFSRHLWQVVRIRVAAGHVELKLVGKVYVCISKLDLLDTAYFEDLLVQDSKH